MADSLREALVLMEFHRFSVLVWGDLAGHFTATLAEPEGVTFRGVPVVGYGATAREAISQVKDYLSWFYKQYPFAGTPTPAEVKLAHFKVSVRPEHWVEGRVFPYERSLMLKMAVADFSYHTGVRAAVIPRLDVEFFYTQGQLKDLVKHYVRRALAGQPPRVMSRYLPPESIALETVTIKCPGYNFRGKVEPDLENLSVVAEPMGTKTFKGRYSRPYGRDDLVRELEQRLLERGSNVLLVGERGSGKTSLLLEALRKVERRQRSEETYPRRFWVTRGARLIAGMRYLGQWEERLEAVIDELSDIEGVLCAENLQELMQTGGRGPDDSIGAFLASYLERGELFMVAEATPRELDACRRALPGLVDLFTLLPVPEFTPNEALEVLGEVVGRLNRKYKMEAAPEVVGEVYRLHKRFQPYHSFPGKASGFLAQLFDECSRRQMVPDRAAAVERFSRHTGLPLNLLKDEELMPATEVEQFFARRVIGQPSACRAVTDLVSTFKAGLNDPLRPLGVLLFCGPTGVGKTEMAKTVCQCFFGAAEDEERLVRLDMSEYAGPGAARRLLGSKERPGELIRRVRQQPFCVVLLDEIEKADPDVFDLLLGVFDEGRLTDPWGRTTTFRSSVLIMTSNLGVSALRPIGIHQSRTPSYTAEVRSFFRPEFFNRIDSVVHFEPLQPDHIKAIARLELESLSRREGMRKRGLRLHWTEQVLEFLCDRGYDERYGARPLKRTIEEQVVVGLSRYLVENPDLRDCHIDLELQGDQLLML